MAQILTEQKLLVKFGDTDPQGILYFARIFELAHEALEDFIGNSPLGWSYWFQNPEFHVPIRHADSEYLEPMRAGQVYNARLAVERWGSTSITFAFGIYETSMGRLCAQSKTTHVFVNREFKAIPIPAAILGLKK